jgi:FKBP-type peptidyl-prolyl cis-trans isomerase FklB
MTLRWSFAALALLAAGSVFAQNTPAPPAQAAAPAGAQQQAAPAAAPITPADKPNLSYAIGFQMGDGLVERKIDVDINAVIRGLQDGFAKRKPTVAEETMRDVLSRMQAQMYTAAKAEFEKLAGDNKAKSQKFLAENKGKKGVVTLPSGLQYVIIEEGTGAKHPTPTSDVSVHYRGSLLNGLEFDSSFARGTPANFKVNEVIKGWSEILPLMRVGDYWRVYVPADMAYGERGQPPRIGPNEALVFELKLVEVK